VAGRVQEAEAAGPVAQAGAPGRAGHAPVARTADSSAATARGPLNQAPLFSPGRRGLTERCINI
jgi:hypothetical protein